MSRKYFSVGTFFGIELRVHYSWLLLFGLVAWTVITSYVPAYRSGLSATAKIAAGLIVTVVFFLSVIAHEYAHSLVANRRGLDINRITLFLFGGASELRKEPDDAKTELLMTAAGPLTSLALAGIFALFWLGGRQLHLTAVEVICQPVALLNFIVGIFNLVPAFPLDGGRILRALLWMGRKDFLVATRGATTVGTVLSYALIALGLLEVFSGYLLGGIWFIIIGIFLLQACRLSYAQTVYEHILGRRKVGDLMSTYTPTVPAETRLRHFLSEYVLAHGQYDFVVVDEQGTPLGLLSIATLGEAPPEELDREVSQFMMPLQPILFMRPGDTAAKAFRLMQLNDLALLPVVMAHKLQGVVERRYLEDYVRLQPLKQPATLSQ